MLDFLLASREPGRSAVSAVMLRWPLMIPVTRFMPLNLRSSARRHTLKYQQHFGFVSPKRVVDRRRGDLAFLLLAVP
jgi:hypothetical protein